MSALEEMNAKVKALERKVKLDSAETRARINNMAKSGEKDVADASCKLEDLAEAMVNLELAKQEHVQSPTVPENIKSAIVTDWKDNLKADMREHLKICVKDYVLATLQALHPTREQLEIMIDNTDKYLDPSQ